jgi:hypothetical protein
VNGVGMTPLAYESMILHARGLSVRSHGRCEIADAQLDGSDDAGDADEGAGEEREPGEEGHDGSLAVLAAVYRLL